ncbi:MAG: hypothetical protein LBT05_10530 [Planctomycetaceae bacterium]|jgi:hypothetical protein|nr:hypothetical protein [Planctomycetaceae bacterium]
MSTTEIQPEISLLYDSLSGTSGADGSASLKYQVINADDFATALTLFLNTFPAYCNRYPYKNYTYEESGFGIWKFTANYTPYDPPNFEDFVIDFDTSGGTEKMVYSLGTVSVGFPAGKETVPDFGGGMNYDQDSGRFDGVQVNVGGYKWSEVHYRPFEYVNAAYRRMLRDISGTVNANPFRDMFAGEVLFLGCQGKTTVSGEDNVKIWELRFSFEARPNMSGLTIGGCSPVDKEGFDFLWILPEKSEDENSNKVVGKPAAVYVERVYRRTNFAALGI